MTNPHRFAKHVLFAAAMLPLGGALAQSGPSTSAIDAQYAQDVRNCQSGRTGQELSACMREAGAARELARSGQLNGGTGFDSNAVDRCQRLPAGQRQDCMSLMQSAPQTEGSVQSGGVLREMTITVPATPAAPGYAPAPAPGYAPGYAPSPAPGYAPSPMPAPGGTMTTPVR